MNIERIRAALGAGPTPGPWFAGGPGGYCVYDKRCWTNPDGSRGGETPNMVVVVAPEDNTATAAFIAACNPAAIRELLAERDALKVENEKLLALERDMSNALPGVYYMDPPDGGDVSLLKQLKRMANDAARYRLLRRKFAIISDGEGHAEFCAINLPRPTYIAPNTAIELDTALDRERLGLDGTRPPTPVGWSDTDWIKRLQEQDEQPHPLAGQHINQGSMDAAADAYEAEYNAARGISEADKD